MRWVETISGLAPGLELEFHPPAEREAIAACERELGHPLPPELVTLLAEQTG